MLTFTVGWWWKNKVLYMIINSSSVYWSLCSCALFSDKHITISFRVNGVHCICYFGKWLWKDKIFKQSISGWTTCYFVLGLSVKIDKWNSVLNSTNRPSYSTLSMNSPRHFFHVLQYVDRHICKTCSVKTLIFLAHVPPCPVRHDVYTW